jgi:hypothetical protein
MRQPPPPTFRQKFWVSLEPLLIILLKDIVLFLIVLAALTIGFAGIAGLKALGIRPDRAEIIETVVLVLHPVSAQL